MLCTGVDAVKNDGFYSATLLNFKTNGTFQVTVRATARGNNQTRLVTRGGSRAFRLQVINGSKYWVPQSTWSSLLYTKVLLYTTSDKSIYLIF